VSPRERQVVDALLRDHHELGQIDRVGALAQQGALGPLLAALLQEHADALHRRERHGLAQRLAGRERRAAAREQVADAPLRDRHQRYAMHRIGERPQVVQTAAQELRLKAGLARERDHAVLQRAARADALLHDAHLVGRNVADAEQQVDGDRDAQT
jgi:hypothetical protein